MDLVDVPEEVARLRGLTETLQAQFSKPKSRLEVFKDYAGILSLLISLIVSTFTIWHNLITEPANALTERETKLQTLLGEITLIDQEASKTVSQPGGDPNDTVGFAQVRRAILLQEAENYARAGATAADEYRLGYLFEMGGSYDKALNHYKVGQHLAIKTSEEAVYIQVKFAQYDYFGVGGTIAEGRNIFRELEERFALNPYLSTETGERYAFILESKTGMECLKGDQDTSDKALYQLQKVFATMSDRLPLTANWVMSNRKLTATNLVSTQCRASNFYKTLLSSGTQSVQSGAPSLASGDTQSATSSSSSQSTTEPNVFPGITSPTLDIEALKGAIMYVGANRLVELRTIRADTKPDATEWPAKLTLPLATYCHVVAAQQPETVPYFYKCFVIVTDLTEAAQVKARFRSEAQSIPGVIPGNPSPDENEIRFTAPNGVHITIKGTSSISVKDTVTIYLFPPLATGY